MELSVNRSFPQHVLQFGGYKKSPKRRLGALVRTNRFALAGAIFLALFIPELLHPLIAHNYPWLAIFSPREPELFGSAAALITAHVGLRRVGLMPLVNDKMIVLPTFLSIFALAAITMSFTLPDVGMYHLVTSCTLGIVWYQLIAVLRARTSFPRLALAGDIPIDSELLTTRIEWVVLQRPRLPHDVLGIVFDSSQEPSPEWERFFGRAVLRNIPVYDIGQLREMSIGRVRLKSRPELVFGQLLPSQPYLRIKRVLDTVAAVPALVLAAPIMLLAALLIQVESRGPMLFRQRRVGYQGRVFTCYKLRSMRHGVPGPAFTTEHDPRVTKVGRFIRKWRIDELPQLVNIIKGNMSWIGPRPEALALARAYQREIPYYAYRYTVRPGISGWAAVHQGNVALVDAATVKLEYDFFYIKYFSLWLDFLIALMTVRTIVTGFGSR